jgi:ketosteroid isomerase-like protein
MGPKKLVRAFYNAHVVEDANLVSKFFHNDLKLSWFSSHGKVVMGFSELDAYFKEINKTYEDLRVEVHHLIKEKDVVAVRCTYFARTIENPEEALAISHFHAFWQVRDGFIVAGEIMSQPASAPDWQPI